MISTLGLRTFEDARKKDFNILQRHDNLLSKEKFLSELCGRRDVLAAIPKHHLMLEEAASCRVSDPTDWIQGSFDVCIPTEARSRNFNSDVTVRCPLPSKLAESRFAGTVDEKMRTEIASYVFMQRECPDIRIPHLYGFGFSNTQVWSIPNSSTATDKICAVHSRRTLAALPSACPYVSALDPQGSSSRSPLTIRST